MPEILAKNRINNSRDHPPLRPIKLLIYHTPRSTPRTSVLSVPLKMLASCQQPLVKHNPAPLGWKVGGERATSDVDLVRISAVARWLCFVCVCVCLNVCICICSVVVYVSNCKCKSRRQHCCSFPASATAKRTHVRAHLTPFHIWPHRCVHFHLP